MRRLKIKVVGDSQVGKTSLLSRWYSESYSCDQQASIMPKTIPPVQDSYFTNLTFERVSYIVTYWDTYTLKTADDLDILKLRPLEYGDTDVFLVCFDISSPSSFQNVSTIWVPELRHYMHGTPLIVVGNKMDLRTESSYITSCLVSQSKGQELAERLGTIYCENSAVTGEGLRELILSAVSLAVQSRTASDTAKKKLKIFQRQKTPPKLSSHQWRPPSLPFPGPTPGIDIEESTFEQDMKRLLEQALFSDVTFSFGDTLPAIKAHRIVLAIASQRFREYFLSEDKQHKKRIHDFNIDPSLISDTDNICVENHSKTVSTSFRTFLTAKQKPFVHFLEFLYTGELNVSEDDEELIKNILSVARQLRMPELESVCDNFLTSESFLNKSILTLVKERRKDLTRELFVSKACLSDVKFLLEGRRVYAHKAMIMARSEVMAAMLGGSFTESSYREIEVKDTPVQAFVGMLEYLYTDELPEYRSLDDDKQLLVLADRYCLSRLRSLCEQRISEQLNCEVRKKLKLSRETCEQVVDAFLVSQVHNASQLYRSCFHMISTNYTDFEYSEELALLGPDDVKLVTENRWPPLSYFKQVEEYKKKSGHS